MTESRRERITARTDSGETVTYRCQIISETDRFIRAHILDKNWELGGTRDRETGLEIWTEWLLDKSLIVTRTPMRQNPKYGTWEADR